MVSNSSSPNNNSGSVLQDSNLSIRIESSASSSLNQFLINVNDIMWATSENQSPHNKIDEYIIISKSNDSKKKQAKQSRLEKKNSIDSTKTSNDIEAYENSFSSELERLRSKSTSSESTITVKGLTKTKREKTRYEDSKKSKQQQQQQDAISNKLNTSDDFISETNSTCSDIDSIKTEEFSESFDHFCQKSMQHFYLIKSA